MCGWNQLEVQGEEAAGCPLVGVKSSYCLEPKQQEREEMEGIKKKGAVGKWCHWGKGSPRHPSPQMLSMTGAGPKGEPWESQGEVLLKYVMGKG